MGTDAGGGEERRDRGDERRDARGGGSGISRWEWLTAALGLVLVVGAIGFLGWEAATGRHEPPSIEVAVDSVSRLTGGGHLLHFTARNEGDEAAAGVVIEGELTAGGPEPMRSQATLDYLPGRSERSGGLFFDADPASGTLRLRALGYAVP